MRLKRIIKENIHKLLLEIASPVLWHFTSLDSLYKILSTNTIKLAWSGEKKPTNINYDDVSRFRDMHHDFLKRQTTHNMSNDNRPYYLSLTRSKSSYEGYSQKLFHAFGDGKIIVRIEFDGEALNNVGRVKAITMNGAERRYNGDIVYSRKQELLNTLLDKNKSQRPYAYGYYNYYDGEDRFPATKYKNLGTGDGFDLNEREDCLFSKRPQIKNANKYIRRIDVLTQTDFQKVPIIYKIRYYAEALNIPIFFYIDEQSFNMQDKNNVSLDANSFSMDYAKTIENKWYKTHNLNVFDDIVKTNTDLILVVGRDARNNQTINYIKSDGNFLFKKWIYPYNSPSKSAIFTNGVAPVESSWGSFNLITTNGDLLLPIENGLSCYDGFDVLGNLVLRRGGYRDDTDLMMFLCKPQERKLLGPYKTIYHHNRDDVTTNGVPFYVIKMDGGYTLIDQNGKYLQPTPSFFDDAHDAEWFGKEKL